MASLYASRMNAIPKSFIREILKVTQQPDVISFAGGLPNRRFFPVDAIARAADEVLRGTDASALQYSTTPGYEPLREFVAQRYRDKGLAASADEVLITNGSQQGLDLIGKVFLDKGDPIVIERPAYLGAIQALSAYEPQFHPLPLGEDGMDIARLTETLRRHRLKLVHSVINFQNPSGIRYSAEKREAMAELLEPHETILVEDDPYADLRFEGTAAPSMRTWLGDRAILLGSFSKTVAPGLRLGWIYASSEIMARLIVAKQASDLHTSIFGQRILHRYLTTNDLNGHLATIIDAYRRQRDAMLQAMEESFPPEVTFTRPEGGMFIWVMLPPELTATDLFERAIEQKVAFVPGMPFFVDGGGQHNLRLNFSNADPNRIADGIGRLGHIMKGLLA